LKDILVAIVNSIARSLFKNKPSDVDLTALPVNFYDLNCKPIEITTDGYMKKLFWIRTMLGCCMLLDTLLPPPKGIFNKSSPVKVQLYALSVVPNHL
jgi:hypothetical protein